MISFIAFFCCRETGILPHGPQLAAVHIVLYASCERENAGLFVICCRQITACINRVYFNIGVSVFFFVIRHNHTFYPGLPVTSNWKPATGNWLRITISLFSLLHSSTLPARYCAKPLSFV